MALFSCNFTNPHLTPSSLSSSSPIKSPISQNFPFLFPKKTSKSSSFFVRSTTTSNENGDRVDEKETNDPKKRLSEQSSWEAKDSEGKDYLYRLGKEADNMNIAVGARLASSMTSSPVIFSGEIVSDFLPLSSVWFPRKRRTRKKEIVVFWGIRTPTQLCLFYMLGGCAVRLTLSLD